MGGTPLPTASTPGFGVFHGKVGCDCVIEFLTAAEHLGLALGLIRQELDVVQLSGNAPESAGVHLPGSCFDVKQFTDPWVRIFRQMGASFFPRTGAAWVGNEHGHGGITCPHDENSAYQMVAWKRGYNGLGKATSGPYAGQWGYGGRDTFWRPAVFRTRAQGIAWAKTETARLEADMATPAEMWGYLTRITGADGKRLDALQVLVDARSYGGQATQLAAQANAKADAMASALGQVLAEVLDLPAEVGAELEQKLKDAVVSVEVNFPPPPELTPTA